MQKQFEFTLETWSCSGCISWGYLPPSQSWGYLELGFPKKVGIVQFDKGSCPINFWTYYFWGNMSQKYFKIPTGFLQHESFRKEFLFTKIPSHSRILKPWPLVAQELCDLRVKRGAETLNYGNLRVPGTPCNATPPPKEVRPDFFRDHGGCITCKDHPYYLERVPQPDPWGTYQRSPWLLTT